MFLLIDNYDSFTYNLYALFISQGARVNVIKNDRWVDADEYEGIIISPGPSSPEHSGQTLEYLKQYIGKKPVFGVCLGMQCIGFDQGYKIRKASTIRHGKTDTVELTRESILFRGVPETFQAVRYHSLAVEVEGEPVTATSGTDGTVMAMEDRDKMYFGVQFHPESFMSEMGERIVTNFLEFVKEKQSRDRGRVEEAHTLLPVVLSGEKLDFDRARVLFEGMVTGELTEAQMAALLVSLRNRGETVDELAALVATLNAHKRTFNRSVSGTIDTCGTGGDGKSTVNVSTAVSIILAAMGHPVVKHGNRAQSGKVGSADILEDLGLDLNYIETGPEEFFDRHGYIFMMAPHYHPALKGIGKVRRELMMPTIFNFVGPLVNPADPEYQVIGVNRSDRLQFIAEALEKLGRKNVIIYSSRDGFDEVSSLEKTDALFIGQDGITSFEIDPSACFKPFEMPVVETEEEAKDLFIQGMTGRAGKIASILALNTALALKLVEGIDIPEGYKKTLGVIESGAAARKLQEITGADLS